MVSIGANGVNNLTTAGFLLYPVPVREVLHVKSDLNFMEIGVVNLNGQEVLTTTGTSVDLTSSEKGTYVIRLRDRAGIIIGTQKIIKE